MKQATPQPAPLKDRLRMMGKCPPAMAREAGDEIERLENDLAAALAKVNELGAACVKLAKQRNELVMAVSDLIGKGGAVEKLLNERLAAVRAALLKAMGNSE